MKEEIIRMALEAGIPIEIDWAGRPSTLVVKDGGTYLRGVDDLERFFHAAYTTGATDERQFIINFLESMHERCLGRHNYYLHAAKLISNLPSTKPTKSN